MTAADPTAALLARRDAVFGRGSTIFYEHPVHLVRGEGVWLFDPDGRRYLDLYNNIPVVGHCNPRVVDALCAQAATHTTHTRYLDDRIVGYGERLLALHHDSIEHVVFTCSGTEANDSPAMPTTIAEMAMAVRRFALLGRWALTLPDPHAHDRDHEEQHTGPGDREAERDILEAGEKLLKNHPEVGAIVCENHNMAPYAAALNMRLGVPIYTVYTFVCWFQAGLQPRYFGRPGVPTVHTWRERF